MESKKIFEEIKKSMGDFPPFYPEYRNKKCTNCYAHALGLHWPDEKHEHYIPGKLSALFNESDIFDEVLITTLKYIRKHENYLYKKTQ